MLRKVPGTGPQLLINANKPISPLFDFGNEELARGEIR
jgi:hypothetical protein